MWGSAFLWYQRKAFSSLILRNDRFLILPSLARKADEEEDAATAELDAHGDPDAFEPHG